MSDIVELSKKVENNRKMTKSDIADMGSRLCVAKKEITYEEMNKRLFGKMVTLKEEHVEAARAMESQREAAKKERCSSKK